MNVVVGSYALVLKGMKRVFNDKDVWTTDTNFKGIGSKYDITVMPKDIMDYINKTENMAYVYDGFTLFMIPSYDVLYTIKLSHMSWDIQWDKHKKDAILLQHNNNATVDKVLFNLLVSYWKKVHKNKPYLSLYKKKADFFDTSRPLGVFSEPYGYKYDHDYLHELVALPDKPMYTLCVKDGQEVAISRKKFLNMTYSQQVRMFKEEIAVIAFERYIVPKVTDSLVQAWIYALRKTVTTLTKGWASEFILLNLVDFYKPDLALFKNLSILEELEMDKHKQAIMLYTELLNEVNK